MTVTPSILTNNTTASQNLASLTPISPSSSSSTSFSDILDTVNPLQHIPVLSNLYRGMTGSTISAGSQIAGDTLYGAVTGGGTALIGAAVGFASSAADVAVKQVTGSDIGQQVASALGITGTTAATPTTDVAPVVNTQLHNAMNTLSQISNGNYLTYVQSEYQRAQALDTVNKKSVQMAV